MTRTVILRHALPDGSYHFDWLIERLDKPGDGLRLLLAFQTTLRPDDPLVRSLAGRRMPDHRREYLDYEGPISEGRGEVRRVASGQCDEVRETPGRLILRCQFEGGLWGTWEARPVAPGMGGEWQFRLLREGCGAGEEVTKEIQTEL